MSSEESTLWPGGLRSCFMLKLTFILRILSFSSHHHFLLVYHPFQVPLFELLDMLIFVFLGAPFWPLPEEADASSSKCLIRLYERLWSWFRATTLQWLPLWKSAMIHSLLLTLTISHYSFFWISLQLLTPSPTPFPSALIWQYWRRCIMDQVTGPSAHPIFQSHIKSITKSTWKPTSDSSF